MDISWLPFNKAVSILAPTIIAWEQLSHNHLHIGYLPLDCELFKCFSGFFPLLFKVVEDGWSETE